MQVVGAVVWPQPSAIDRTGPSWCRSHRCRRAGGCRRPEPSRPGAGAARRASSASANASTAPAGRRRLARWRDAVDERRGRPRRAAGPATAAEARPSRLGDARCTASTRRASRWRSVDRRSSRPNAVGAGDRRGPGPNRNGRTTTGAVAGRRRAGGQRGLDRARPRRARAGPAPGRAGCGRCAAASGRSITSLGVGRVLHPQGDAQVGVGPDVLADRTGRALGGQHQVDAEAAAALGDADERRRRSRAARPSAWRTRRSPRRGAGAARGARRAVGTPVGRRRRRLAGVRSRWRSSASRQRRARCAEVLVEVGDHARRCGAGGRTGRRRCPP